MFSKKVYFLLLFLSVSFSMPILASAELKCTQSMDITNPRFGVTAEVGVEVSFSDIGCAVVWRNLQCAMDQMEFDSSSTVQDYNTEAAVPMEKAFFTLGCGLETPMNYDIAAFKFREDAETFAAGKENCKVLSYDGLMDAGLK